MAWRVFKKGPNHKKWTVEGRDHLGVKRRLPAYRDVALSNELAKSVAIIVDHKRHNTPLPPLLAEWVPNLAPDIRDRLASYGLLDSHTRPLSEHLHDYEIALTAKGNTTKATQQNINRIQKMLEGCKCQYWSDMQGSKIQRFIAGLKAGDQAATPETRNHYLGAIKAFCRWAVRDGRLPQSPIEHLNKIEARKVRQGRRHERRALTVAIVQKLLVTAEGAPERFGMIGPERAMLYRLGVETALRVSELRSLTKSSFVLEGDEPMVTVASAYTKNNDPAAIPLRAETVLDLRAFLANKLPDAPAFNVPPSTKTASMIREDLEAAGIPYRVDGKVADFHSLRHTCGSWLAAAGIHPKVIQRIMRHSTITLTMDRYTHLFKGDEAAAVEQLPDLSSVDRASMSKTGTDDAEPSADSWGAFWGALDGQQRTPVDSASSDEVGAQSVQVLVNEEDLQDLTIQSEERTIPPILGPVAELADAADLKSAGP